MVYKDEGPVRVMVTEAQVGRTDEPTLRDLSEALIALYGTDYGIHSPTWISRFTDMTRQAALTATGGSCWPATPRTCIPRWAGRAQVTADGPLRIFTLLHHARPVLLNLGEPGSFDITPWADRVQSIDAKYAGTWELPALGTATAPTAVLIRPDGYVAWVGDLTQHGLADALSTWFGLPAAA